LNQRWKSLCALAPGGAALILNMKNGYVLDKSNRLASIPEISWWLNSAFSVGFNDANARAPWAFEKNLHEAKLTCEQTEHREKSRGAGRTVSRRRWCRSFVPPNAFRSSFLDFVFHHLVVEEAAIYSQTICGFCLVSPRFFERIFDQMSFQLGNRLVKGER
jgi:hypothetical protein